MQLFQRSLSLIRQRGFHLITYEVIRGMPAIKQMNSGICHIFIRHTSASITINENADPTARIDLENWFNRQVPENDRYGHDAEGTDGMPAHIKAALLGNSVTVPIVDGRLALGIWQGIYLCEHRIHDGEREIVLTVWGTLKT